MDNDIIGPIILVVFVFVVCWAIMTTYMWRVAERTEPEADKAIVSTPMEFHKCRAYGPESWEFDNPSFDHLVIAWAVAARLKYPEPKRILGAGRLQPVLQEMYPNAEFGTGVGSLQISESFKSGTMPCAHAFRAFCAERLGKTTTGVVELKPNNRPLLDQVREVLGSTHTFMNGPTDLAVFAQHIHDSLGTPHTHNKKHADLTGAEYTAYGDDVYSGPEPAYRWSPPTASYLNSLEQIRAEKD